MHPLIRKTSILLLALSLTACDVLPGLQYPELTLRPQYHALKLRGDSSVQTGVTGGAPVDNPSVDLENLGVRRRDDDVGGTLAYGDGFSGLELSFLQVDLGSTERGTTPNAYGNLATGARVSSEFFMDEYRLSYIARLFEHETDDELKFRIGAGPLIAHRDASFTSVDDDLSLIHI